MFNGLEGIMGSGKSYEATVFHVLAALKSGRKVVTNLPLNVPAFLAIDPGYADLLEIRFRPRPALGTWDATRVDEHGNGNAFLLGEISTSDAVARPVSLPSLLRGGPEKVDCVFGGVWDFYDTWRHPDGRGPLFVVDECHNCWPKNGTDTEVVQYIKLHRHFNADILGMTQSFRDINQAIAGVVAMLVKVRKADILGKPDSYIRKVHAGYRGAVIATDERKYQPHFFPLYKSHTQGVSVAESAAQDVTPMLVKFNRWKWAIIALGVVATVYAWWPKAPVVKPQPAWLKDTYKKPLSAEQIEQETALLEKAHRGTVKALTAEPPAQGVTTSLATTKPMDAGQPMGTVDALPEPYQTKGLHLTGQVTMGGKTVHVFAVSQNGAALTTVSAVDLERIGYIWNAKTDCAGYLQWMDRVRAITCDSPMLALNQQSRAPAPVQSVPVAEPPAVVVTSGDGYGIHGKRPNPIR
jgi:zona occludens toxin